LEPFKTKVHSDDPVSAQLEIETYTWDVSPDDLRTGDIGDRSCASLTGCIRYCSVLYPPAG
jgi:hypothetical protein